MTFSFADMYPGSKSNQAATAEQTIPEVSENESYQDTVSTNADGMKKNVSQSEIFGALALFVGLLVVLHFLE
jgi:hypothetical protein